MYYNMSVNEYLFLLNCLKEGKKMKKLKIAVIGVGGISQFHIESYKKLPCVELYAFCDINDEILKWRGESYGITRLYTDEATMLAELPEIDAVSVCTWNSAHAPCAIMALNAGKHVLCEKPMALNAKQAKEMQEAAIKNNRILAIGFVRRFGNDCGILKEFIDSGDFGDVYYSKATYVRRYGFPGGWFGDKERSGGGPLIDLGVHVIDLVRYLNGNPKPVTVSGFTSDMLKDRPGIKAKAEYNSVTKTDGPIFNVEDFASALIRFDNGMALQVETSFNLNCEESVGKLELFGSKAGARIDESLHIFTQQHNYLTNVEFEADTGFDFEGAFSREIAHFVDCIENGTLCINPAEDGVTLMKILDAVYESSKKGCEISLK